MGSIRSADFQTSASYDTTFFKLMSDDVKDVDGDMFIQISLDSICPQVEMRNLEKQV